MSTLQLDIDGVDSALERNRAFAGARDLPESTSSGFDASSVDPTQGRRNGSRPHDDPTQGRRLGSRPDDDPTRAR
jgi:hypothetical protein